MSDYINQSTSATAEEIVNQTAPEEPIAAVSGTVITEDVDTSGNADILAAINAANETYVHSQWEEEERRQREEEEELARIVAKRQQENLERRIRLETEARAKREEEERLALEAERAAKSRPFGKFSPFRGKEKAEEPVISPISPESVAAVEPEDVPCADTSVPEEEIPPELFSDSMLPEDAMPLDTFSEDVLSEPTVLPAPFPEEASVETVTEEKVSIPAVSLEEKASTPKKRFKMGHIFFRSKSKPADTTVEAESKETPVTPAHSATPPHLDRDGDELVSCSSPALIMLAIRINGFFTLPRAEGDTIMRNIQRCIQNNSSAGIRCFQREDTFFLGAYDTAGESDMDAIRRAIPMLVPNASLFVASRPYQKEITAEEHNMMLFSELETQLSEVTAAKREPSVPYNERLSNSQRSLKQTIMMNHERMYEGEFADVYQGLQRNLNKISIIFMASPDFNTLFIFQDPDEFFNFVATEVDNIDELDCSYIYALHEGGTVYYGADDYMDELTNLFQKISAGIMSLDYSASPAAISKAVGKIPGINIFENIYVQ